jgi:hypothetical protein
MVDVNVRDELEKALRPLLPKRYRILPTQSNFDAIVKPIVVFKQTAIGRQIVDGKTIPGGRIVRMIMTIAVPFSKTATAEKALDDDLITLLDAIDRITNVRWTTAEKRIWSENGQEPCYDVNLEIPFSHNTSKEG